MVDGLTLPPTDRDKLYDLIVVGGGSAGFAAAMETARAGVDTLVIEREDIDETDGAVKCIRCCPEVQDWPEGENPVGPRVTKGKCFNLDVLPETEVTSIKTVGHLRVVGTKGENEYRAKAILLSPGSRHRRLNVPGEEDLIGVDIHHCAACEGPAYAGQEIVVVGSGDFGIEQTLALATYASRVTVLEIRDRLTWSNELKEREGKHTNLEVRLNTKVLEFKGNGRLASVVVRDLRTGKTEDLSAVAAFVFMGSDPNTDFLRGVVELDPWGFIMTDERLKTSFDGVYAAGDARSSLDIDTRGSAEEGVAAASEIRRFLGHPKPSDL